MTSFINMKNKKFGSLVGIKSIGTNHAGEAIWLFKCDCGKTSQQLGTVVRFNERRGIASSCGCLNKSKVTEEQTIQNNLHYIWTHIKSRCTDKWDSSYARYGGRGITFYSGWLDFELFMVWCIENGYKKGLQLDRENNNQGYNPGNCRWVTPGINANNKEVTRFVEVFGEKLSLAQAIEKYAQVDKGTVRSRVRWGWEIERALTEPAKLQESWEDLSGQTIERLTLNSRIFKNKVSFYECSCSCGKTCTIREAFIRRGHTKSCGCLNVDVNSERRFKHGLRDHPLYTVWDTMHQKCKNPKNKDYAKNGALGIVVCDEWKDFFPYYTWCMANGWEKGKPVFRKVSTGDFTSSNCTIGSVAPGSLKVQINGETLTLFQAQKKYGKVSLPTVHKRLDEGWDLIKALETPAY